LFEFIKFAAEAKDNPRAMYRGQGGVAKTVDGILVIK
jgi:hypothetical protein